MSALEHLLRFQWVVRQVGVSGLLALHEDDFAEDLDDDVGKTKKAADLNRTKESTGRQT